MQSIADSLQHREEPDGAILSALSGSQTCFKHDRITIPPAIVLARNDFLSRSVACVHLTCLYSTVNPPPHWGAVRSLCYHPRGGGVKKMREGCAGGGEVVGFGVGWCRGAEEG
ncbi:hypothetical protein HGRIS_000058 [Hohenbuehelia grisea]|uniref:Uncharacterized protein n=1 Tax=Hohenbuehelia grisea TaxID=104357 RepID=A0ABR3JPY4_9AGAR